MFSRLRYSIFSLISATTALYGCALIAPLPEYTSLSDRLAMIPRESLPLEQPVTVFWNHYQIPFIHAQTDTDAAFVLGLIHAHLRLGQMEVMRRISQGRIAEMIGPLGIDIDHALRILDYGKVTHDVLKAMPLNERAWLDSFVAGINHYQNKSKTIPHEYTVLGLDREPWTPQDIITLGRLVSTDVNWVVWFRLLSLRDHPQWPTLWASLIRAGMSSVPSFPLSTDTNGLDSLSSLLLETGRFGSNAMAVAKERSTTGHALFANDPHLGLSLPNLWLIAGIKSPSYHMVGFMIPGLPFIAVGRNQWIAWGGTNARTANSDLFDISDLESDQITSRTETIRVRWWFDTTVTVRDTVYGPIISDIPQLSVAPEVQWTLKWAGHIPTDELSAMLAVNRAHDWTSFRNALKDFISPQNFLYSDINGNIGQLLATQLPSRPLTLPTDIIRSREEHQAWQTMVSSQELPWSFNPAEGFLTSANNRIADAQIPLGYFFSSNDRIVRMQSVLDNKTMISPETLAMLQQDVYQSSSIALRDALLSRIDRLESQLQMTTETRNVLTIIRTWDGYYRTDSSGALAFEAFMTGFISDVFSESEKQYYFLIGQPYTLLLEDLPQIDDQRLIPSFMRAFEVADNTIREYQNWGTIHQLSINHFLGLIPVIGRRYRYDVLPTGGSRGTLLKTSHFLTIEPHLVRFGANARYIADLSTLNRNWFVLLGGQDGWLNSTNFRDQVTPWQRGEYIQVPLDLDMVKESFSHHQVLLPDPLP